MFRLPSQKVHWPTHIFSPAPKVHLHFYLYFPECPRSFSGAYAFLSFFRQTSSAPPSKPSGVPKVPEDLWFPPFQSLFVYLPYFCSIPHAPRHHFTNLRFYPVYHPKQEPFLLPTGLNLLRPLKRRSVCAFLLVAKDKSIPFFSPWDQSFDEANRKISAKNSVSGKICVPSIFLLLFCYYTVLRRKMQPI